MDIWESNITLVILFVQCLFLFALYATSKSKVFLVCASFLVIYSLAPVLYDYIFAHYAIPPVERYKTGLLISAIISIAYALKFRYVEYFLFFLFFLVSRLSPGNIPDDIVYYSLSYTLECLLIIRCMRGGLDTAFGTHDLDNYHPQSGGMAG